MEGAEWKLWARMDHPGKRWWCPEFELWLREWRAVNGLSDLPGKIYSGGMWWGRKWK